MKRFLDNRREFPAEELEQYAGQWIAWSPDGTRIVASSAESEEALLAALERAGEDPLAFVFDYVPGPDGTHLGGL
jgi:hypothetical protein